MVRTSESNMERKSRRNGSQGVSRVPLPFLRPRGCGRFADVRGLFPSTNKRAPRARGCYAVHTDDVTLHRPGFVRKMMRTGSSAEDGETVIAAMQSGSVRVPRTLTAVASRV